MHSLEDAKEIAQMIIDSEIKVNKNADITLSDEILKSLGNDV